MSHLHIVDEPAKAAGEHINKIIQEHVGDIVCLLAAGSAFEVIKYIKPGKQCFHEECQQKKSSDTIICGKTECRTIFMMGDERVSREHDINNYLQLESTFYGSPVLARTIATVPNEGESRNDFASRIENYFLETLTQLSNPKIIFVLGVGTDGHTAGIFPMDAGSFRKTYQDDRTYVPVHLEGLKIDSRASFTPNWILEHADVLIGFVSGVSKKNILEKLHSESKNISERPAELLKIHKHAHVYTDIDIVSDTNTEEMDTL